MEFGLWYPKGNEITFIAYPYIDWEGCVDDIRRTTGTTFFLEIFLVSWSRKKKSSVSLSTTKEKYIAIAACYTLIICMKKTM